MRPSDQNKLRKLRFGQAILLGVEIESRDVVSTVCALTTTRWYVKMPAHFKLGYINGPFLRRWEAVDAALRHLEVIEDEPRPSVEMPIEWTPGVGDTWSYRR